jgi:PmbA protein
MSGAPLLGEDELRRIARLALEACEADQAEVLIYSGTSALTRFANNYVHQNVEERDTRVQVRAVLGKKIGIAASDILTVAGIEDVVARAAALARLQQENPDFVSLPAPAPAARIAAYVQRTAAFEPAERAEVVRAICEAAAAHELTAAGAFRTAVTEVAVANSLGAWAYHRGTTADINTVVMGETSSGHAERVSLDAGDIDGHELANEAIGKCLRAASPQTIEPGTYEVILEEYAVADLLDYFAYLSFGAQAFLEKRSFMAGRLGEKVMADDVSIWDDGLSLDGVPAPFDAEGVPRRRVDLVQEGIARDVVWDSYYGAKGGHPSTGHALPAGETFGPAPGNLFLATGDATKDDMVASVRRGLWVSRFWYTRPVHPLNVVVTGMIRDGTFLIEDGRIKGPVRNLRFTQSYLQAMNDVEMIGKDSRLLPSFFGYSRVPALKIARWDFTGATDF